MLLFDMHQKLVTQEQAPVATIDGLEDHPSDIVDQANQETPWMVQIKMRSHESDLLSDIEKVLYKVECGRYGYCEHSAEPTDSRPAIWSANFLHYD